MSYCPKCNEEIPQMTSECTHCGYDFSDYDKPKPIEVSALSTTVIIGYQVIVAIMFIGSVIGLPFSIVTFNLEHIISNICILFLSGGSYFLAGRVIAITEYLQKKT